MTDHGLRRTRHGWAEPPPPPQCVNGHPLRGGNGMTVGVAHCAHCGLHRTISCGFCDAVIYRPVRTEHCSFVAMDGRRG